MRKLTKRQRKWLKEYEDNFGMDAMYLDDYLHGKMTWNELCSRNYSWLEDWVNGGIRCLERIMQNDN